MVNDTQQIPAGYKQTDVGVIPEDWELGHLGAESDLVTKGTTPTSMGKNFTSSGINFVKVESLDGNGCFDKSLFAHIDQSTHTLLRRSQLKENDLLISIAGALGRAGIVKSDILPANTNQALSLVRLSKDSSITLSFLYYFVKTPVIKKYIDDVSVQGAQPNLSLKNISDLPIYYPSDIHEQEKIVEILLDIDSLISKLDQLIQKKKNIKQGAMQEMLTGKRRLPGFSGEWEEIKIEDIFRVTRGLVLSMKKTTPLPTGKNKYPVYSSQTLHNGLAGYYSEYLFEDCITWTTDGANAGDVKYRPGKFYCTNVCGVLESHDQQANSCIAAIFNSVSRKYVSYVGNPKLMNNVVAQIRLKIPGDVEEQKSISKIIDDLENEILILETRKNKYINLKQGMMQQLLTGKIRLI